MTSQISDVEKAVDDLKDAFDQKTEPIITSELVVPDIVPVPDHVFPWERLPDETDRGWALFSHYRDTGLARSFVVTAKWACDETKLKDITSQSLKWRSMHHNWSDRVASWDKEQERLYAIARNDAMRKMVERHEIQIVDAIDGLMAPIEALNLAIVEDDDFIRSLSKMDARKLISLANTASRTIPTLMAAERLARGMPTEIHGGVVEHQVVHIFERDQIAEVLEVLDRSSAFDDRSGDSGNIEDTDTDVVEVHSVSAESND